MVRYPKVPAQDVVLYYVLMEFGSRRRAYLYQVANVLAAVLVFAIPVLITKIQYRVVFLEKNVHTNYTQVHWYKGTGVLVLPYPCTGFENSRMFEFVLNYISRRVGAPWHIKLSLLELLLPF